jgi:hypothetical protein
LKPRILYAPGNLNAVVTKISVIYSAMKTGNVHLKTIKSGQLASCVRILARRLLVQYWHCVTISHHSTTKRAKRFGEQHDRHTKLKGINRDGCSFCHLIVIKVQLTRRLQSKAVTEGTSTEVSRSDPSPSIQASFPISNLNIPR